MKIGVKNGVSIRGGSPTYYRGPHKIFFEKIFLGAPGNHIHGLYDTKNGGFWVIPKKGPVNTEMDIKNGVSIGSGSPTHYGGPHNFFEKIFLGALGRQSHGLNKTHEKSRILVDS
ncbi:hypothetical protein R3W88_022810 [Solanum pinnatisectum]|uniref:Uncharacterized protein n=1 Tax=Solanum pinnatisectum TaxID=50273 RepID=A0AAV9LZL5_9SOLN|nr:hypothetical protein R3W88_022810 [Solanum pinnatisectum]